MLPIGQPRHTKAGPALHYAVQSAVAPGVGNVPSSYSMVVSSTEVQLAASWMLAHSASTTVAQLRVVCGSATNYGHPLVNKLMKLGCSACLPQELELFSCLVP